MNCPICGERMNYGAPHCETIKIQRECGSCGNIEPEYYTTEELKTGELTAATGASLVECRAALEQNDYDTRRAERVLSEGRLERVCRDTGGTGEGFARKMMGKAAQPDHRHRIAVSNAGSR